MALDAREAALALHRFGFGPRSGSMAAIAPDPRGALLAELERPNAGQIANADLPSSGAANRAVFEYNAERAAMRKLEKKRREVAQRSGPGMGNARETKGEAPSTAPVQP